MASQVLYFCKCYLFILGIPLGVYIKEWNFFINGDPNLTNIVALILGLGTVIVGLVGVIFGVTLCLP